MPGIDQSRQFVPLKIAVLTVSDTRAADEDKSGATLIERIRAAGHVLAERAIVKDEIKAIRQRVKAWIADKSIDVYDFNDHEGGGGYRWPAQAAFLARVV